MTLPWLPFFFAAIWKFGKEMIHRRDAEKQRDERQPLTSLSPLVLFSMSWLLVPLVFFSLSSSKLPGYLLPAVPAAILLTSVYVFRLVASSGRWKMVVLSTTMGVFATSIVLLFTAVPRFADTDTVKNLVQAASDQGHSSERVYSLHTVSHSSEFYAAGRLLRDASGNQKKLYGPAEVVSEMQRANVKTALVIVPLDFQKQLTESNLLRSEAIKNNGELAIVLVTIN